MRFSLDVNNIVEQSTTLCCIILLLDTLLGLDSVIMVRAIPLMIICQLLCLRLQVVELHRFLHFCNAFDNTEEPVDEPDSPSAAHQTREAEEGDNVGLLSKEESVAGLKQAIVY